MPPSLPGTLRDVSQRLRGRWPEGGAAAGPLTLPVTMNEMLLRGCMLKNSRYILGLVVYTGPESRIQMNAAKTPNKVGAART